MNPSQESFPKATCGMEFNHEVSECILLGWLAAMIGSKGSKRCFCIEYWTDEARVNYDLSDYYDQINHSPGIHRGDCRQYSEYGNLFAAGEY